VVDDVLRSVRTERCTSSTRKPSYEPGLSYLGHLPAGLKKITILAILARLSNTIPASFLHDANRHWTTAISLDSGSSREHDVQVLRRKATRLRHLDSCSRGGTRWFGLKIFYTESTVMVVHGHARKNWIGLQECCVIIARRYDGDLSSDRGTVWEALPNRPTGHGDER